MLHFFQLGVLNEYFSLSQEHFDFDFDSDSFLFADKIATEQYEYNDSFRKIEQIKYAIQEAGETSRAIESIQTVIAQEGIKSKHEGRAIASYCTFAIDHVVKCAAIENKITMLKHEYTVFQNHLNFYK